MSKRRGLPSESHMRHDSHFVDSLSERFGAVARAPDPDRGDRDQSGSAAAQRRGPRRSSGCSIESKGVLEPLLVRPCADGRFRIIAGERRFRAALEAGLTEVPCIELDVPDNEVMEIALIENLHRRDLHPFEEAMGYASLAETARLHAAADRDDVGKSRVSVTEAMSLLQIPEDLREKCRRADIEARSVLLEIARLGDREKMEEAIAQVAGGSTRDDLREQKKGSSAGAGQAPRVLTSSTSPRTDPSSLNISFQKTRVAKAELIDALRGVIKQLESGELPLGKNS